MVDTAMDLWVTNNQGFVPVQSAGYVDPDLVAQYAGAGYIATGDVGFPEALLYDAAGNAYPVDYSMQGYPLGTTGSTLGANTYVPTGQALVGAQVAPAPAGAFNWWYVVAIAVVIAVAYYLLSKRKAPATGT